jgi:hypothetical protein
MQDRRTNFAFSITNKQPLPLLLAIQGVTPAPQSLRVLIAVLRIGFANVFYFPTLSLVYRLPSVVTVAPPPALTFKFSEFYRLSSYLHFV